MFIRQRLSGAEKLALLTTLFGLLHHLDHVLRVNHSGWPFLPQVNVFTATLLVYPVIALVLVARGWPRLRIALAGLLFLFPTLAHIFLETPAEQYRTWALQPEINMLGVTSPALGVLAATITVLLSLSALAVVIALIRSRGR